MNEIACGADTRFAEALVDQSIPDSNRSLLPIDITFNRREAKKGV